MPRLPEHLGRPHVPDSSHELLSLESLREWQLGSSAKARDHLLEVRRELEDVRPETSHGITTQLEDGPVPLRRLVRRRAENQPGRASHGLPARTNPPPPVYA